MNLVCFLIKKLFSALNFIRFAFEKGWGSHLWPESFRNPELLSPILDCEFSSTAARDWRGSITPLIFLTLFHLLHFVRNFDSLPDLVTASSILNVCIPLIFLLRKASRVERYHVRISIFISPFDVQYGIFGRESCTLLQKVSGVFLS